MGSHSPTTARSGSRTGAHSSPVHAANAMRNAQTTRWRAARWRRARVALWRLLDRYVKPGDRVAVVGAGNGHDVPLRRLHQRAGHVDLIDLDAEALRRARRRRLLGMILQDVTFGYADGIATAAVNGHAPPRTQARPDPAANTYDVVIADLLFTQLLYPALIDAELPTPTIDSTLQRHGQPLTDSVAAWLHTSAPHGVVIHVHDLLGWWPGHSQPFALDAVLARAEHDLDAALKLAQTGNVPHGCDPRQACDTLGATILDTALWHWRSPRASTTSSAQPWPRASLLTCHPHQRPD